MKFRSPSAALRPLALLPLLVLGLACDESTLDPLASSGADGGTALVPTTPTSDASVAGDAHVTAPSTSTTGSTTPVASSPTTPAAPTGPFEEPGLVQYPVGYTILVGAGGVIDPNAPPPGANHWSCRSSTHPRPIVLVHATFANEHDNWATLAPLLWNEGYCVYTFDYGGPPLVGTVYGIHDVASSAAELADFVDEVLSRTGATQVDLVGHSQGGMMPRYYLKFLGGASKVASLVAMGPSNHGTTLDGLTKLMDFFGLRAVVGDILTSTVCPACTDQINDSSLMQALNDGGDTVPGVKYTVIATKYDEVVTPYTTQFLSGPDVTNLLVQDYCALDLTGHIGLAFDPITLRLVLNALDPASAQAPKCKIVPFLG